MFTYKLCCDQCEQPLVHDKRARSNVQGIHFHLQSNAPAFDLPNLGKTPIPLPISISGDAMEINGAVTSSTFCSFTLPGSVCSLSCLQLWVHEQMETLALQVSKYKVVGKPCIVALPLSHATDTNPAAA